MLVYVNIVRPTIFKETYNKYAKTCKSILYSKHEQRYLYKLNNRINVFFNMYIHIKLYTFKM